MKYVKTFEAYDEDRHRGYGVLRSVSKTKIVKGIAKFASIIDDLKRLDFKALFHSLKNNDGGDKLEEALFEIGIVLAERSKYQNDLSFEDMEKYGIDSGMIIRNLEDPSVLEYFRHDKNIKKKIDDMKELIDFIKEYDAWKNGRRTDNVGNILYHPDSHEQGMGDDYKKYFR